MGEEVLRTMEIMALTLTSKDIVINATIEPKKTEHIQWNAFKSATVSTENTWD